MEVTITDYGKNVIYCNIKRIVSREYTLILTLESEEKIEIDGVESFFVENENP